MKTIENLNIDASAKTNVLTWLNGSYDEETKQAIRDMVDNNPNELNESFYRNLEFGTGGLRGIMEGIMTDIMFDLPQMKADASYTLTAEEVKKRLR